MALGSGLGSQLGFAKEASAWATRAAPDHWLPAISWDIQKVSNRVTSQGVQAGAFTELLSQHVEASQWGTASVTVDFFNKQMGLLLTGIMGGLSGPTQLGGTAAYSQTHTLAAINPGDLKSLTLQGGIPKRSGGTAICKELQGARVVAAEFTCDRDSTLQCSFELVGKKLDTTQSLGTVSYSSGLVPFRFADGTVKAGTYGAESALSGVRSFTLRIERAVDEPLTFGGAGYFSSEPQMNGFTTVSGSISYDYDTGTKAAVEDLSLASTLSSSSTSLVFEFVQSTAIAGSYYPTAKFTVPGTVFEAVSAVPNGVDITTIDQPFKSFFDGTNQPSVYTVSVDTAL